MSARLKRNLGIAGALLAYAIVVALGIVATWSSVPREADLVTIAGRLDDVRVSRDRKTGDVTFHLEIEAGGGTTSIHLSAFGRPATETRLREAVKSRETVTVRYRKLPFGNRGFAVADHHGDVLSFSDAKRHLEAAEAARGNERYGPLLLYGGLPPILLLIIWLRRRQAPPAAPGLAADRDPIHLAYARGTQRWLLLAMLPMLLALLALGGVPKDITRVFGEKPFGLPPMATFMVLTAVALLPLGVAGWHLVELLQILRQRTGRLVLGKWTILFETLAARDDPRVQRLVVNILAAAAGFAFLISLWIVAAS